MTAVLENANAGAPAPLAALLPGRGEPADADTILARFMGWVASTGLALYPAQEEALLEIMADKHVVLNTPTGSGKSLVATALHFKALAEGRTSYYTCPIKASSSAPTKSA
jgi:superfamily II RNA helicase